MQFQVVPPCGGHHAVFDYHSRRHSGFKSCPRVGGILRLLRPAGRVCGFKSCPRVGGIAGGCYLGGYIECFKSCPRVGGILVGRSRRGAVYVSSRAPVWGASIKIGSPTGNKRKVSSRAPVWGASSSGNGQLLRIYMFQVVPPCGGHPTLVIGKFQSSAVSSRAPVWGASTINNQIIAARKFQVVPPCGGHPLRKKIYLHAIGFKSCPRVGGIQ